MMMSLSSSGISDDSDDGFSGIWVACAKITFITLSNSKGARAVSKKYATAPSE